MWHVTYVLYVHTYSRAYTSVVYLHTPYILRAGYVYVFVYLGKYMGGHIFTYIQICQSINIYKLRLNGDILLTR